MLTVYTLPNCGPCAAVKRWLAKHGERYNELDAQAHGDWLRSQGFTAAPVVVVRDERGRMVEAWSGYRPERMRRAVIFSG